MQQLRLPFPLLLGLAASTCAIALWIIEQLTDSFTFELLTIPAKLLLLAAFPLFLGNLSSFLHRRPAVAFSFFVVVVGLTILIATLYLPWRDSFCERFSNDVYRWYYAKTAANQHPYPVDLERWLGEWRAFRPHLIEVGILLVFYAMIVGGCTLGQLRRGGGVILGLTAYAYLLIVPVATGLVALDYDFFLKGIAFDSISLDLFPIGAWKAWDFSIFLYSFMLIFFTVSALFFYVRPRTTAEHTKPASL